jgi:hypothetical protein
MKEERNVKSITVKQVQEEFDKRHVIVAEDANSDNDGESATPKKKQIESSRAWVTRTLATYNRFDAVPGLVPWLRKNELSASQEGRSWCAKRNTLDSLAKLCKTSEELSFVVKSLLADTVENMEYHRKHLIVQAELLLFRMRLVLRLQDDFKVAEGRTREDGNPLMEIPFRLLFCQTARLCAGISRGPFPISPLPDGATCCGNLDQDLCKS